MGKMTLMRPGVVILTGKSVTEDYAEYCKAINRIVGSLAIKGYSPDGRTYVYQDRVFKFTYIDSDYGNDKYCVEVHQSAWDSIPDSVNPFLVNEGGAWNYVYEYIDGKEVLSFHIPGSWFDKLIDYDL